MKRDMLNPVVEPVLGPLLQEQGARRSGTRPLRPYLLVAGSRLERIRARIDAGLALWRADWGVPAGVPTVHCERAADAQLPGAILWRQRRSHGEAALWLAWPGACGDALAQAMFGDGAATGGAVLAAGTADAAFEHLVEALVSAALSELAPRDAAQPDQCDTAPGGGGVLLRLRIGKQEMLALLNAECVAALAAPGAGPAAALAPVDLLHCLRDLPLRLRVRAGSVQLSLGSLATAGIGDVIRLDAPVDGPVDVLGPGAQPLLQAYLGQSDGAVAIELSGRTPPR